MFKQAVEEARAPTPSEIDEVVEKHIKMYRQLAWLASTSRGLPTAVDKVMDTLKELIPKEEWEKIEEWAQTL